MGSVMVWPKVIPLSDSYNLQIKTKNLSFSSMAHTSPGCHEACGGVPLHPDRVWHSKYLKSRQNYRSAKATVRQQATKSRQLIAAVTDQLLCKDEEIKKVRSNHKKARSRGLMVKADGS